MSHRSVGADRVAMLLRSADDETLARALYEDVRAIVRSTLRAADPHLILTAVHDALLVVVRYRHTFRGRSRGSTWLYTLTRREALRTSRGERRHREHCSYVEDVELLTRGATPPVGASGLIAREWLEERVPNPRWREMWLLHNDPTLRLDHQEIARRMGYSEGSVAVTLSRVRGCLE